MGNINGGFQFLDQQKNCKIVIVGGGIAGTYLAFKLAQKYGSQVCLFDKDKHTGGRLYDIPVNPQYRNSPKFGIGGRRLLKSQEVMVKLAYELNITLEKPEPADQFCFARGKFQFVSNNTEKDLFLPLYSGLQIERKQHDYEDQLVKTLFNSPERKNIINYPSLRSYMESVIGHAGFEFLRDMTRFKSDYLYPLSAQGYIDWAEEEYTYAYDARYPVGGMSQFVKELASKAKKLGAQIFKPEKVHSISRDNNNGYLVAFSKGEIKADRIILAIPANALKQIHGDVIDSIKSQSPFKDIVGVRIMTITQWFKTPWWMSIKRISNGRRVWRAWTTDSCLRAVEIPLEPSLLGQNVFRVAYLDDINCIEHFDFLRKTNNTKLEEEIHAGLRHLFENNGITTPVKIPRAIKTVIKDWQNAWYWLKSGSLFTNRYIADWASNPLKHENVGLASDSYFMQRTGWSEAAILSADKLLKRQYPDVMRDFSRLNDIRTERLIDNSYEVIIPSEEEIEDDVNDWDRYTSSAEERDAKNSQEGNGYRPSLEDGWLDGWL